MSTTCTHQMTSPDSFVLLLNGEEAGTFSFMPDKGPATVLAGLTAAAITEFFEHHTITGGKPANVFTERGWSSEQEYEDELELVSWLLEGQPSTVRVAVKTAWLSEPRRRPLSRTELTQWQIDVEAIIANHLGEAAA